MLASTPIDGGEMTPSVTLEAILEALPQAASVFDGQLRLVAFNRRYSELLGYSSDLLMRGASYATLSALHAKKRGLGGADLDAYIEHRVRDAHGFMSVPQRLERTMPDGRVLEIHRGPWPGGGFISTYSDITERKRADDSAKRSAELLETTLENMADGIRVYDSDLRLVVCNRRALEMFDHPPFLGRVGTHYSDLLAYNEENGQYAADPTVESTESRLERAKRLINRKTPYFTRDGRVIEKRRNAMPNGGFVATYRDITELYKTQQMLLDAKQKAESASRSKSEFLANMSHELRTPLNPIIGFSEIMEQQLHGALGSTHYDEYVKAIKESALHLLSIINDILDIAKIEAGKAEPSDDDVRIGEIILSCRRLMQESATQANIALEANVSDNIPRFRADPRMVKQIILNLLSNAIKFTPAGGKVTVVVEVVDALRIIISDTGIGMSAADIEKALTPFEQADRSITRKYQGTGLGLPLARSFARLHGGDLMIDSKLGEGTAVTVTFPAHRLIENQ